MVTNSLHDCMEWLVDLTGSDTVSDAIVVVLVIAVIAGLVLLMPALLRTTVVLLLGAVVGGLFVYLLLGGARLAHAGFVVGTGAPAGTPAAVRVVADPPVGVP